MFRNPRENAEPDIATPIAPSIGRPPTPPNGAQTTPKTSTASMSTRSSSTKTLTPRANSKNTVPTLGRQGTKPASKSKTPSKPNASILSFFKKIDGPPDDNTLFLPGSQPTAPDRAASPTPSVISEPGVQVEGSDNDENRFNESGGSVKRRRLSGDGQSRASSSDIDDLFTPTDDAAPSAASSPVKGACTPPPPDPTIEEKPKTRRIGAFVDDSDSENDSMGDVEAVKTLGANKAAQKIAVAAEERALEAIAQDSPADVEMVETVPIKQEDISENAPIVPDIASVAPVEESGPCFRTNSPVTIPVNFEKRSSRSGRSTPTFSRMQSLKKEDTDISGFGGYEDMEDEFMGDEFAEGEEFIERKWMQEQAMLEAGEMDDEDFLGDLNDGTAKDEEMTEACPLCDASLAGISADDVTRHVNACLDGKPIPLPSPLKEEKREDKEVAYMPPNANTRFSRSAIPRPGQANPFEFGQEESKSSSAFSKIMASKAEDMAWANAAAAENASRGKPAYQRTCPFYKIMPGFFICVDAFRYGAVEGCNGYFLSHFHSDHYIGLTSSWCHGPIYCSKVTGNLVKQQLKVDPKWVVQIDFEKRMEIPGTHGVYVTMIPANHCPGSSLYLFEKVIGKGPSPKMQRVLHCGDFRACPAHIAHPLLMPQIVDSISGKTKQQKIDVCYLDTTYLNPRYAFPSQEDVIKACADMCVSLSKDKAEDGDAWETVKRERAGAGMTKFVENAKIKPEDDSIAMTITPSEKPRGRLLVICGTYSIGKERICMGIARALDCKIWAPPGKQRICAALEDPELSSRMTTDPREAQIHMQMLMEIRAETLQDYLNGYKPHFTRVVGFRPSGWNYRPPNSRFVESPLISTVLNSDNWRSRYHMSELVPQRGSTKEASCFGVPYSEHSSFRELTMFCCALNIEKIIPTVNVGSAPGRAKMKSWIDRWLAERRKNGVIKIGDGPGEVRW